MKVAPLSALVPPAQTTSLATPAQAPKATGYGLGLSIVATGLCLLPGGVTMLLLSPVSARISAARGPRITLALGTAIIASGYVLRIADSRDLWAIILGATVCSIGEVPISSLISAIARHGSSSTGAAQNAVCGRASFRAIRRHLLRRLPRGKR